jgi:hypothetical protein
MEKKFDLDTNSFIDLLVMCQNLMQQKQALTKFIEICDCKSQVDVLHQLRKLVIQNFVESMINKLDEIMLKDNSKQNIKNLDIKNLVKALYRLTNLKELQIVKKKVQQKVK